jgi:hypothetical protein
MRRVGASADPTILEAFWDAGIIGWDDQMRLTPGDSLFLGADLVTDSLIRRAGQFALPGVHLAVVTASPAEAGDLELRRRARTLGAGQLLALPGCLPYLRRHLAVLETVGAVHRPSAARPLRVRVTVTTGETRLALDGDDHASRDLIRAGIINVGLGLPEAELTVSWHGMPTRPGQAGGRPVGAASPQAPPGPEADVAVAAAVLTAAGTIPAAALVGRGLVGELGLDGRIRPVPNLPALLAALHTAGLRRVVIPAVYDPDATPAGLTVEPVPDLPALVTLLRRP